MQPAINRPALIAAALCGLAAPLALAQAPAAACSVRATAAPPKLVELYTSEGCSSCPPADRWLSTLKGRADLLALGFHVSYWDRLGWPDRFASAEGTARQHQLARSAGRAQVYTPQVIVDGDDWTGWPRLPRAAPGGDAASGAPAVSLARTGDSVAVEVAPRPDGPPQLAGYWAVLEDGHTSAVRSGENAGQTLRHDHVVRLYQPVPAWTAAQGLRAQLAVTRGDGRHPRRVAFVVTGTGAPRPLQAVVLGC
ncbi:MAG: DUF1223 domain-containing protein [Leptothrix sp. (in: Bacteria)]|nr:DUF1223 domain-containing protein [Leptothrix sp. (in: b-proteobacteria)]